MKPWLWIILVFAVWLEVVSVAARSDESSRQRLSEAATAYQQGDYQGALLIFRELETERSSSGLYYNIGNCHARLAEWGRAAAAYHAALRRNSHDADTRHNLQFVLSQTGAVADTLRIIETPRDVFLNLARYLTLRAHQMIFLGVFTLFLCLLTVGMTRGFPPSLQLALVITSLLMVASSAALGIRYRDASLSEAVVIEESVTVRYGPSHADTEAFVLPEATLVHLQRENADWLLIRIPDGKSGWLPKSAVTLIP